MALEPSSTGIHLPSVVSISVGACNAESVASGEELEGGEKVLGRGREFKGEGEEVLLGRDVRLVLLELLRSRTAEARTPAR